MIEFIKSLFPTTAQLPFAGGGAVLTLIFNSLFPLHEWLVVLLYAMVVDFILGVMAAFLNDNLALDSRRGNRGLLKKVCVLVIVSLCSILATEFNISAIYYVAVGGYISIELLSIIENAGKAGIPIPAKLRDTLAQLTEDKLQKK